MDETALKKLKDWPDRMCQGTDLELWFGPSDDVPRELRETKSEEVFRIRTAKAVCAGCPIKVECLESELTQGIYNQHGVRGGKTANERQQLIRDRRDQVVAERIGEVA
ncbi:WhiB family redox-sensing transcriptional regulator [Saccharothrix ecbatanensis]|uniref:WhiB family redox-sensing transcriptional regulator n=1 Tax=Saccharothrix ecbatanensis TaxID=1105145 RepID=A0A7W9HVB5_9PSEU|nr:WhiB family transcriptional regulator [Saccharothrix ecbatanensis]MBB5808955.1 WhiB family redox-sensing transcriptional regulator [Saccharothrix ecbatanensis]